MSGAARLLAPSGDQGALCGAGLALHWYAHKSKTSSLDGKFAVATQASAWWCGFTARQLHEGLPVAPVKTRRRFADDDSGDGHSGTNILLKGCVVRQNGLP